ESLALAREIGYHRAQLVILQNLACLLADQDHYPQAVSYFQQGVRLAREHAFRDALMGLLGDWGYRALRHADLTCAEACCQESLALARAMGHSARVATRLSDLGEVARRKGDFQTALTYQEEAHKLAKQANLAPVAPLVALRFANLYADLGQFQRAEESLTQCLLERDALHDEFEGELHDTQQRLRPPT
ncbi:MAG: tetratricopeptide repeat protein, partial [Anaerolineales bacterium]|nr:tetratricopeptide repeat protein [Anaerolineales bacterium]